MKSFFGAMSGVYGALLMVGHTYSGHLVLPKHPSFMKPSSGRFAAVDEPFSNHHQKVEKTIYSSLSLYRWWY
ncbi:MAG: hypothetical protein P8J18_04960 [Halieaceae bacterium]|nr:hypothetical protein [Halieaceae bacterium]